MRLSNFIISILLFSTSCQIRPKGDSTHEPGEKVFTIKLKPGLNETFNYRISSELNTNFEVKEKKFENVNQSDVEVTYVIQKDSMGDATIRIQYNKLHIHLINNNQESEWNASQDYTPKDNTEQLLNALINGHITATMNKTGDITNVTGYQDIADQLISHMNNLDLETKIKLQKQWDQMVHESIVKKNLDQLFSIFPDTTIRIGEHWKNTVIEKGDISFKVNNLYLLKSIDNGVAFVETKSKIEADSSSTGIQIGNLSNLQGNREGVTQVNINSGRIIESESKTNMEGSLQVLGREIPLTIRLKVKIKALQ